MRTKTGYFFFFKCQNKNSVLSFRKIFANVGVSTWCVSLLTCQMGRTVLHPTQTRHITDRLNPRLFYALQSSRRRAHSLPADSLWKAQVSCTRLNNDINLRGRKDLGLSYLSVNTAFCKMPRHQFRKSWRYLREKMQIFMSLKSLLSNFSVSVRMRR